MKTALVTGITGQDGSYLAELLLAKGYVVHGLVRRCSVSTKARIVHLLDNANLHLHDGDLSDGNSIARVVEEVKPQEVYNLGAQSHVGTSYEIPEATADVSGIGALRVLEAVRRGIRGARVYQASTSELFSGLPATAPQSERTPFRPMSPYGVAKLFAYWTTVNYRDSYGMFTCNGILFNHESPRRGTTFVTRKVSQGVAAIAAGRQSVIKLGNLNAERDWGYAPEYVEAMWLLLQQDDPRDLVIATGRTTSVRQFVEWAFEEIGVTLEWGNTGVEEVGVDRATGITRVSVDPAFYRPNDVVCLIGDATRAEKVMGWQSTVTARETCRIMVHADLRGGE